MTPKAENAGRNSVGMGAVTEEDSKKRWRELAGQVANEKDPEKRMELIKQIKERSILEARKRRLKGKVPSIPPTEEPTD
jgi:hypothetical protein